MCIKVYARGYLVQLAGFEKPDLIICFMIAWLFVEVRGVQATYLTQAMESRVCGM